MADPKDNNAGLLSALRRTSSFGGSGGTAESPDIYKKLLGHNSSELAEMGNAAYRELPPGSRHHAMASHLMTQQLRPALSLVPGGEMLSAIAPQVLGAGVELGEAALGGMKNPNWKADTLQDLQANLQGSAEAISPRRSIADLLGRLRRVRRKVPTSNGQPVG